MVSESKPARAYFTKLRKVRAQERMSTVLLELVDMGLSAACSGNYLETIEALKTIKQSVHVISDNIDNNLERFHASLIEKKVLEREIVELNLELARLRGDDLAKQIYGRAGAELDEFFSAAISDLDPGM